MFKKKNLFYSLIFIFGILLIAINRFVVGFDNILWIIDVASFFSILYVIFTAKHTVWGLVFDLVASCILIFTNAIQHLWLNLLVCAFAVPNMIIGIVSWKKNERVDEAKNLKTLSKKSLMLLFLGYFFVSAIFAIILCFIGGNLFWLDAIYSAGCSIGLALSSFAFIDQFYIYIFADSFGIVMYTMLTIQNINNITMIFVSLIYIIGNFYGLFNWKRINKNMHKNATYDKQEWQV